MTNPNDTQVAGNHYKVESDKGNPQHWDLVATYGWDYFQAQVTKYLMRWKTKHKTPETRLEDLKKARHFLDKYIALEQAKLTPAGPAEVAAINAIGDWDADWEVEGFFTNGERRFKCRKCKKSLVAQTPPSPHVCW